MSVSSCALLLLLRSLPPFICCDGLVRVALHPINALRCLWGGLSQQGHFAPDGFITLW